MVALGVFFLCSSYFVSQFSDTAMFSQASGVFILAMAAPSYVALVRWIGARRGLMTICIMCVLPVLVEAAAIWAGFPYGDFRYSGMLGYMVLGVVPWSVAFAYPPILLGSMTFAGRYRQDRLGFTIVSAVVNVLVDLVVDPGAVHSGLWAWVSPGPYYGVPLVNFLGWLLTGFVYSNIFLWLSQEKASIDIRVSSSLVLILCFWSGYLLVNGLYAPALLGIFGVATLLGVYKS